MTNKFITTLQRQNTGAPPIWFMRQAGRYHAHYQNLRRKHGFVELCKNPELAAEVALGPMEEFDFDAAILFSDILYPLELLGVDVDFAPGPQLSHLLQDVSQLPAYQRQGSIDQLSFQAEALQLTREKIGSDKGLISFIGGPLTLYLFAVQQSRKDGVNESTLAGLTDGRFAGLMDQLIPILVENMSLQASANPDCIAILDSAADILTIAQFETLYLPYLNRLMNGFKAQHPDMPLLYYGKGLTAKHWDQLVNLPISAMGISHHEDLPALMNKWHGEFALQGNLDPAVMTLEPAAAEREINVFLKKFAALPAEQRQGWIAGLGHGITPQAREENVHLFIKLCRGTFA